MLILFITPPQNIKGPQIMMRPNIAPEHSGHWVLLNKLPN